MSDGDDADRGAAEARELLAAESVGLLSTISVHRPGYPYGSLAPYALSARGQPLLLLSELAAHTKNLRADPRGCLFVGDRSATADPQASGRISLLGRAARLPEDDRAEGQARYLARWPQAAAYFQMRDFALWELDIEELRLIAGFGSMMWLPGTVLAS